MRVFKRARENRGIVAWGKNRTPYVPTLFCSEGKLTLRKRLEKNESRLVHERDTRGRISMIILNEGIQRHGESVFRTRSAPKELTGKVNLTCSDVGSGSFQHVSVNAAFL